MGTARVERVSLLGVGALVGVVALGLVRGVARAAEAAQAAAAPASSEASELRSRVERLEGKATDQSHVMADVGYHFANLWFAGEKQNWPLAEFCFDETRSHLRWAVRVIPVRKTPAGQDLELKGILDALDAKVIEHYGKAPEWWRKRLDCRGCPSAAEVADALHPPRPTPSPSAEKDAEKGADKPGAADEDDDEEGWENAWD